MKMNFTHFTAIVFFAVTVVSCKKNAFERSAPDSGFLNSNEKNVHQVQFATTLARAVKEEPGLRAFIKAEALKQFDKDYDVLFQMVKDTKVNGNATFYEVLIKYANDKEKFEQACNKLPLMTIFVPKTPGFSPETWNPEDEIPVVAVEPDRNINSGKVSLYDHTGKRRDMAAGMVPGFPVVVVKENERVVLNTAIEAKPAHIIKESVGPPFFSNDKFSFKFWDLAFDNLSKNDIAARVGLINLLSNNWSIDKVNVDAYNAGAEWQRDYVYYGITPGTPNGVFTNRFSEFITSFQFVKGDDVNNVADQAGDPQPRGMVFADPATTNLWTEGNFEFRVSIFINAKNGVGMELKKGFSARGTDLFDLQYEGFPIIHQYHLVGVTPRAYNPNIEIVPWDLDSYGSAWKFAVSEYDPVEEHTRTVTNTTTFGGNFEINLNTGEKTKIGGKFGLSLTTQHVTQYTYKFTTGNDDFFEGILDFRTPVITGMQQLGINPNRQIYTTYEVTTGYISMSVEPKRIY